MKLILNRFFDNGVQTIGELKVIDQKLDHPIIEETTFFQCFTLELGYHDNQTNISCIPAGIYTVRRRWSPRHGSHLLIEDVEGRSWILIHAGNFYTDISGCILVGENFTDLNNDGYTDVTNSKATLKKLMKILESGSRFELEITNRWERSSWY